MTYLTTLLLLLVSALLEVGGDAMVRVGLHAASGARRVLLLGAGGLVLFGYGCFVNAAPWDFGRLLGVYVVLFFLVAQLLAWLAFGEAPTRAVVLGGLFILLGGVIVTMGGAGSR